MKIESGKHLSAARNYLLENVSNSENKHWGSESQSVLLSLKQVDELSQSVLNALDAKVISTKGLSFFISSEQDVLKSKLKTAVQNEEYQVAASVKTQLDMLDKLDNFCHQSTVKASSLVK